MKTERLTVAQALVKFLGRQKAARDGRERQFLAGVFGIFGHGNVAGIGEALLHRPAVLPFYVPRNEQAMVHTAAAFAKASFRLRTLACTTSIGPGATNMITGAAAATINRLPVLLLPGDIFATRRPDPVLQQLESTSSRDVSVNDCLKPVSRFWDRINRPEQLTSSLLEAMRVLTSPADTGAVTIGLPQDVQTEAFDYPAAFFEPRVWTIPRNRPDRDAVANAARAIRAAQRPLLIAGGGVLYSEATDCAGGVRPRHRRARCRNAGRARARCRSIIHRRWGRSGVTGTSVANHLATRGRRRRRRRLPAERLHQRLEHRIRRAGGSIHLDQRRRARRGQARIARARRRRTRVPRGVDRRARRLEGERGVRATDLRRADDSGRVKWTASFRPVRDLSSVRPR